MFIQYRLSKLILSTWNLCLAAGWWLDCSKFAKYSSVNVTEKNRLGGEISTKVWTRNAITSAVFTVYSSGRTNRVETSTSLTRSSSNLSRGSRCDRYNVGWDRVAWVAVARRNRCYRQPPWDTSTITRNEIVYLPNGRLAYSSQWIFSFSNNSNVRNKISNRSSNQLGDVTTFRAHESPKLSFYISDPTIFFSQCRSTADV